MRVFVAGASGAIGSRLVPQLIERGHEVIGTIRSPPNADRVRALRAEPMALDLLDARAVRKAVLEAEPDAIVHQATALAGVRFSRNLDRSFAQTNRLRTEGTDALLAAAREAGVGRLVAQSFASMRYAREGGPVKTEDDPLDPTPLPGMREAAAAMRYLDEAVTGAGGTALRYGVFYGASNDGLVEPLRKRQFPIVGGGGGVSSFIHHGLMYRLGFTPWERRAVAESWRPLFKGPTAMPPGRALDVGCGSGADAVFLATRGWRVTAVEFVEKALARARRRAAEEGVEVQWVSGDVARLGRLGLEPGYGLLYDFGCIQGLSDQDRRGAAAGLGDLAGPGARLLLVAFKAARRALLPRGMDREEVVALLGDGWELEDVQSVVTPEMPGPVRRAEPTLYRLARRTAT